MDRTTILIQFSRTECKRDLKSAGRTVTGVMHFQILILFVFNRNFSILIFLLTAMTKKIVKSKFDQCYFFTIGQIKDRDIDAEMPVFRYRNSKYHYDYSYSCKHYFIIVLPFYCLYITSDASRED
uniref:Uncharacterized protein n=1 Tax=Romanomermis culicivorax TaxID=13658 RepID=A0A915JHU8_ROMCU